MTKLLEINHIQTLCFAKGFSPARLNVATSPFRISRRGGGGYCSNACIPYRLKFTCYATLSAVVKEQASDFSGKEAALLVDELRSNFNSGRTKSYEWRISQLQNIARMIDEKEKCITEALYQDLSKPELEAFLAEVFYIISMSRFFTAFHLSTVESLWYFSRFLDFEYKIILYACNQRVKELDGSRNGQNFCDNISLVCTNSLRTAWSCFGYFSLEFPFL